MNRENPDITHAVVVIHGSNRDADLYFNYAVAGMQLESTASDYTAIFSLHFALQAKTGYHHWSTYGWRKGDSSSEGTKFSSFEVMNEFQEKLIRVFPNLNRIVFIGHSAGGQFTNRYAGGADQPSKNDIDVRYVVLNPASYIYLDAWRPAKVDCSTYNNYLYGLSNRNVYMRQLDSETIINNYFSRKMYVLVGDKDTSQKNLDMSCGAKVQGEHRLIRARNYQKYMARFPEWQDNAYYGEVKNVGHQAKGMLTSSEARSILYRNGRQ